jgi:hypothetical protein
MEDHAAPIVRVSWCHNPKDPRLESLPLWKPQISHLVIFFENGPVASIRVSSAETSVAITGMLVGCLHSHLVS